MLVRPRGLEALATNISRNMASGGEVEMSVAMSVAMSGTIRRHHFECEWGPGEAAEVTTVNPPSVVVTYPWHPWPCSSYSFRYSFSIF